MISKQLVVIQNCNGNTIRFKKLAQMKPGDIIQFKWITVEEASKARI